MKWEIVMGLEVHIELSTKSKIFCGCTTAFGGEPNTHVCPICSAMPGTLPKLNRAVVEYAIRAGLALNCSITRNSQFDRKNYFYPDLPKAYQISQLYMPICRDGFMEIDIDGAKKNIGIRQIHMEEDAGKLVHDPQKGSSSGGTQMDFNRCGVPLLEIVSQPDFRSTGEVLAYLEKLRETLLYLGVSDCKMQEGSLRADVNLSVRRPGEELGVRTETKNLNSFKAIGRAIDYEIERQIDILEDGGKIIQETRRWDDDSGESYSMRSKENAHDYRYFPEPDLLPVHIDETWLSGVRESLPELAFRKRERYIRDYGISADEALILTCHKNISGLFEALADKCTAAGSGKGVIEAAHLISGEIMRLMNNENILPENLDFSAEKTEKFFTLIGFVTGGKINRASYKETVEAVFKYNADPEIYITEKALMMVSDDKAVTDAVKIVMEENRDSVAEYRAGKEKIFGFLMGMVMKKLGKGGNPELVKKVLEDSLKG